MDRVRWAFLAWAALGCILELPLASAQDSAGALACPDVHVRRADGRFLLEWTALPGAEGYDVYAQQGAAFVLLGHTVDTSWSAEPAAGYRVTAAGGNPSTLGCAAARMPANPLPRPMDVLLAGGGLLAPLVLLRKGRAST